MDVFDNVGDIDNGIGSGRYDAKVIILVNLVIWRTLACFAILKLWIHTEQYR